MSFCLFGCGGTKYNVDYHGQKDFFIGAKDSYAAGTKVKLRYDLIATDTDYTFYVDGKEVRADWDKDAYVITFTMPAHDTEVYAEYSNTMLAYLPQDQVSLPINSMGDGVLVDDLFFVSYDYFGMTAEEMGVPDAVVAESVTGTQTVVEGDFNGREEYGILYFDEDDGKAYRCRINVKNTPYEDVCKLMETAGGTLIDSGEEPYVEVDGGAVTWSDYEFAPYCYHVKSASERDYVEVVITKMENE